MVKSNIVTTRLVSKGNSKMTKSSQNISKADIEVALDRILIDLSKRFNVSKDEITEDFLNAKILEEYNKRNEAAKESGMEIFGLT